MMPLLTFIPMAGITSWSRHSFQLSLFLALKSSLAKCPRQLFLRAQNWHYKCICHLSETLERGKSSINVCWTDAEFRAIYDKQQTSFFFLKCRLAFWYHFNQIASKSQVGPKSSFFFFFACVHHSSITLYLLLPWTHWASRYILPLGNSSYYFWMHFWRNQLHFIV